MGMLLSRYHNNNDKGVTKKVAPSPSPKIEEEPKVVAKDEFAITAEEIKKMTGAKLRRFAKENGVEDPEELTVGELKAILCEKFS